ncbi:hypothetical protein IE077_001317, partial [Cardiosporidium cionae]
MLLVIIPLSNDILLRQFSCIHLASYEKMSGAEEIQLSTGEIVSVPIARKTDNLKQSQEGAVEIEKVKNVWGSSAGAGSDFLDIYRKHRTVEMDRLQRMDEEWKEDLQQRAFQIRRKQLLQRSQEASEKRARKRKAKKQRKLSRVQTPSSPASFQFVEQNNPSLNDEVDILDSIDPAADDRMDTAKHGINYSAHSPLKLPNPSSSLRKPSSNISSKKELSSLENPASSPSTLFQ